MLDIEATINTNTPFSEFGLHDKLLTALAHAGWENASPIQEMTITPVVDGQDIFAQAETGSGKTGSFAIPILERHLRADSPAAEANHPQWIVLSPTRELAQQTDTVFQLIGKELGITTDCVIGGESMDRQIEALKNGVHVLVATPGRLGDLLKQGILKTEKVQGVVFDEADRLFDMGFKKEIEFILGRIPKSRQMIMVSATTNLDVLQTAYKFHSQPVELKVETDGLVVDKIDHQLAMISREEKFSLLVGLLRKQEDAYAIVFCNTQFQTHSVAEWLIAMGFKAQPISGRMPQNKRTRLMEDFRAKKVTILVCTDVAARGLDIKKVNLVVNYDLPQEAASYVHRIGRTGRAGEEGLAVSFCAFEDCEFLDPITRMIGKPIPKMELTDEMFATDICKKPYINKDSLKLEDDRSRPSNKRERDNTNNKKKPEREKRENSKPQQAMLLDQKPINDKRSFIISAESLKNASSEALHFWRLNDEGLLGHEIVEQGRKKFIFFGPRKNKYKFFIKPIYKRILTPFIEDIVLRSGLDLQVRVSFKEPLLKVTFSGDDEKMLSANNGELTTAFEHLIKEFLVPRVEIHKGLKLSVRAQNDIPKRADYNNDRPDRGAPRRDRPRVDEKALIALAEQMKQELLKKGAPVLMKALSPAERRIIHQHLSDDPKVKTSSVGDGRFKQIEITLR